MKQLNRIVAITLGILIPVMLSAQIGPHGTPLNASSSSLVTQSTPVSETEPQRTIINSDVSSITIQYRFHGFEIATKSESGLEYQFLQIKDFSKMGEVGNPALPAHNDLIMLPGGEYTIQILEAPYKEYTGFNIYPALEPASDEAGTPEPTFERNNTTYSTNAFFPSNLVELKVMQKLRGINVGVFQIRPIQYNPVTHIIRVYDYIKYKIVFSGINNEFQNLKYRNSTNYLNLINHGLLNNNLLPRKADLSGKSTADAKDIILITTPTYQAAADTLARWKRQLGYTVKIIARSSWTSSAVNDSVHNLYQNWNPHPDYLIILGDQADVPAQSITYSSTYYLSDLYYVCMDGTGDYIADMAHGRISVSNATQAMTVVQKIVNYERNPVTDASFYSNALASTYFQDGSSSGSYHDGYADRRFVHTTEEIRSYLMTKNYSVERVYCAYSNRTPTNYNNGYYSQGQPIPSDLLKSNGFLWDGDAADLISGINSGKFLVFHRDHGYTDGYGWEHPYFLNQESSALVSNGNHINQLSNGAKTPVVMSINCHTGDFRRPECFAENFLRKSNGGAVGVIAPSYSSYSGYNDALSDGLIDAIWSNPGLIPAFGTGGTANPTLNSHTDIRTMGDVLNQGLLRMVQTWASSTKWQMQCEIYNYFGDPSMKLWTSAPTTMAISGVDTLIRLDSIIHISCSNCADATAVLMVNNNVIASTNLTSGNGTLNFSISGDEDAILCISGSNMKPFIKNIHINNIIKQTPPASQAKNLRFIADGGKSISLTVEWDKGDGDYDLVKISDDGNFSSPVNGTEYTGNTTYSGSGEQVVFSGAGTSVTVYNLSSQTTYWFRVYEYNNEGVYTLYQTITESDNPNTPDGSGTLPVKITTFSAKIIEGKVHIDWVTLTEINNDYFNIEKSFDAVNFETIGKIKGNGSSNIPIEYSYVDNNVTNGVVYYRLVQVDIDGSKTESNAIKLDIRDIDNQTIISKISQDMSKINIICNASNQPLLIRLLDLSGKVVYSSQINTAQNSNVISIPKYSLPNGMYLLALQTNNNRDTRKLIIQ